VCERRIGSRVEAASAFTISRLVSPVGAVHLRRPRRVAIALTDDCVWLLELRNGLRSPSVGAVLGHFPRDGLVARWRRQRWTLARGWWAELCWPATAAYIEGSVGAGPDADRIIGLLAADEFERDLRRPAPAT
jgi:hypothetical protein